MLLNNEHFTGQHCLLKIDIKIKVCNIGRISV